MKVLKQTLENDTAVSFVMKRYKAILKIPKERRKAGKNSRLHKRRPVGFDKTVKRRITNELKRMRWMSHLTSRY